MNDNIYSCSHESIVLVINTTFESLASYSEWKNNNPENLCYKCWFKKRNDGSNK